MKKYVDTNTNEIFFEDEKTGKIYDENMHEVYENTLLLQVLLTAIYMGWIWLQAKSAGLTNAESRSWEVRQYTRERSLLVHLTIVSGHLI